jgi:CheY-like chemotaxis protein
MSCRGKRILVAEDNAMVGGLIYRQMEGAGADCTIARDGSEAWKLLESESFDLLIIDDFMPGMNGSDVCRLARQDPRLASLPIIMVTARYVEQEVKCLQEELGVQAVVAKPFDPAVLQRVVEEGLAVSAGRHGS